MLMKRDLSILAPLWLSLWLGLTLATIGPSTAQQPPAPAPVAPAEAETKRLQGVHVNDVSKGAGKYGTGRIAPPLEVALARHKASNAEHAERLLRHMRVLTVPPSYDCLTVGRDDGIVGDQGQCGDCHLWSAAKTALCAQYTAALQKADGSVDVSVQWLLDCQRQLGGCSGGDEYADAQIILAKGIPSLAQYPGSGQGASRCGTFTGAPFKILTQGYCDPNAGPNDVASTLAMQSSILMNGPISVAGAAGSWGDPGQTIMVGAGGQVDHAIMITGWKPNPNGNGKVVFKVKNQWSKTWGDNGYCWIQEGSYSIGTGAFFLSAGIPAPVPGPPTPIPPSPIPVVPGAAPVITSALTASGVVGQPFSYQATASGAVSQWDTAGLPPGLSCSAAGLISGTPTTAGVSSVVLVAINGSGAGQATLSLTVTSTPATSVSIPLTSDQIALVLTTVNAKTASEVREMRVKDHAAWIASKGGYPCPNGWPGCETPSPPLLPGFDKDARIKFLEGKCSDLETVLVQLQSANARQEALLAKQGKILESLVLRATMNDPKVEEKK